MKNCKCFSVNTLRQAQSDNNFINVMVSLSNHIYTDVQFVIQP